MTIAIDFDGVLVQETAGGPLVWQRGAKEGLQALRQAGHKVFLHTARALDSERLTEAVEWLRSEGVEVEVWTGQGKPYADVYLDDRAVPVHGPYGVTWDEVVRRWGVPVVRTADWPGDGDPPRLRVLLRYADVTVWLVDGTYVREAYDLDFTQGGHHYRYGWIPVNEVWIDDALHADERPYVIAHEAVERRVMAFTGATYEIAHEIASRVERGLRDGRKGATPEDVAKMNLGEGRG